MQDNCAVNARSDYWSNTRIEDASYSRTTEIEQRSSDAQVRGSAYRGSNPCVPVSWLLLPTSVGFICFLQNSRHESGLKFLDLPNTWVDSYTQQTCTTFSITELSMSRKLFVVA